MPELYLIRKPWHREPHFLSRRSSDWPNRFICVPGAGIFLMLLALCTCNPLLADVRQEAELLRDRIADVRARIEALEERQTEQQQAQAQQCLEVDNAWYRQQFESIRTCDPVAVIGAARVSMDAVVDADGIESAEVLSNNSRIGVIGTLKRAFPGVNLFYRLAFQYQLTDEVDGEDSRDLTFGQGFAGAKGPWGAVRFGRLTTEYKKTGLRLDPWADNIPQARAGGRQGMSELHSSHFNNAADYVTPKLLDGLTGSIWFSIRPDSSEIRPFNPGALRNFQGGDAGGLGLKFQRARLLVAADWLRIDADTVDIDGDGRGDVDADTGGRGIRNGDAWQVGARYQLTPPLSATAMFEDAESIGLGRNLYFNLIYRLGKARIIGTYGRTDDRVPNGNVDWRSWSIGAKYSIGSKSELLAAWGRRRNEGLNRNTDTLTVGLNVNFGT